MAKQNAETTAAAPLRQRGAKKKVSVNIIKMKKDDKVEGTFTARTAGPWSEVDTKTGEVTEKELVRLHFTKDDGEKFIIFEDGGLRNAMANAVVNIGDYIEIVKLDQVDIGKGRKSNQYDIYQFAD